ncbi:MAG TPA: AraC family transcriptional regulator [Pseudonocardiaceae bacterium]|nr:AraC family transcriptional regulator [Pseudonocardiaceae bacterium]
MTATTSSPAPTSTPRSAPWPACCAPTPTPDDLTHLARTVGLSPGHLSRLFKAQTGVSLSRYRNQQRLHRFQLAYGNGDNITALSAALAAGFGSYAQFYRVFRQETGRTPSTSQP